MVQKDKPDLLEEPGSDEPKKGKLTPPPKRQPDLLDEILRESTEADAKETKKLITTDKGLTYNMAANQYTISKVDIPNVGPGYKILDEQTKLEKITLDGLKDIDGKDLSNDMKAVYTRYIPKQHPLLTQASAPDLADQFFEQMDQYTAQAAPKTLYELATEYDWSKVDAIAELGTSKKLVAKVANVEGQDIIKLNGDMYVFKADGLYRIGNADVKVDDAVKQYALAKIYNTYVQSKTPVPAAAKLDASLKTVQKELAEEQKAATDLIQEADKALGKSAPVTPAQTVTTEPVVAEDKPKRSWLEDALGI